MSLFVEENEMWKYIALVRPAGAEDRGGWSPDLRTKGPGISPGSSITVWS